jgi:pimeloyl-ACP methyl ester carboxylesterase
VTAAVVERRQLAIGPRSLSYLAAGPFPCRRLAVFLHAFPLNAEMWLPQLRAMPEGWAAVAPDFRGFGESTPDGADAVREEARLEDYAADVLALMDAIGVSRAALVGCSMGGYAALALLRCAPGRAGALLLADTRATADTGAARAARAAMLALLDREGPAAVAADMRPKLVGPTSSRERPGVLEEVDRLMNRASSRGTGFAIARIRNRADATAALAAFRGQVCVVVGEEDTLTPPSEAASMAALVPGAALVTVPRAGHLSSLEAPDVFSAAMLEWLRAIDGATAEHTSPEFRVPDNTHEP